MIVTIWRHGEAGRAPTDRQRELTGKGLDDIGFGCHQFSLALQARGMAAPDLILYSPWVRTEQTAEVVSSAFTHARTRELGALQPGGTVAMVESAVAAQQASVPCPAHLVLVSHQPLVSELLAHFLGAPGEVPSLSPGALATVELSTPAWACAVLHFWAVPPEYQAGI
jgi:phosphohistidine phosphatase SixA